MNRYIRLRFILPAALTAMLVFIYLRLQGRSAPALDGYGPDPRALGVLLLVWILGIGLALSTLYALLGPLPKSLAKSKRAGAAVYHLALWLVVGGVIAAPQIRDIFSMYQTHQTAAWKAANAVAKGTLKDVEKYYTQARRGTDDLADLNNEMKSAAFSHSRTDVLMFLKGQGVPFAERGQEGAWIDGILEVLRESRHQPQATFETVRWLIGEGAPLGFSLKAKAADFSDINLYFTAYEAINDPATSQLLDLLVANGADTVGCKGTDVCPVVYVAGKGMTHAVRYLLAHGANPNSISPDHDDTALFSAIRGASPETVKVLLDAGARLRFDAYDNDLVKACGPWDDAYLEQSKAVVRVLHDANIHMTAEDLARYQGPIYNDVQRACINSFM